MAVGDVVDAAMRVAETARAPAEARTRRLSRDELRELTDDGAQLVEVLPAED
jgi:hypothetical protein